MPVKIISARQKRKEINVGAEYDAKKMYSVF